ncbi:D-alanine--D-alanine ligase [Bifidobacterium actinocoloniiforme DSM 22766]|uniref:D-alanine--D-alanine ligase n=1 Tax=Bifidobacterium actinocoloniiforme DSM 22766 TaxID=1437605 RepID=A0A086Z2M6_9BIFI|nr:ATP-grasp domain-containing protein [Bifidobacterium actinocoloniiforme]AKV55749.1 D-alanine--D-alanine ligase [Bifidobacterium actinocoloniiforme DSM 22766]KFI40776.1 D-alanine--D-alanine ligase [Bifidobacterium actinocoloniiforme DSM 22766]
MSERETNAGPNPGQASILVVCGGLSTERDVSLSSGHRVRGFLREAGWQVTIHDLDQTLLDYLTAPATRPDLVWPLLHGADGEDGSIRDILDMTGLPYIGSRAKASRTAWNKPIAKNVVRQAGLSTPHSVTLPESIFRELGARQIVDLMVESLGLPLFVKPSEGGSAMGCSLVDTPDRLPQALINCFAYGPVALIEQAVNGTEISVSVLEIDGRLRALPPLEIWTPDGIYNYEARATPGPTKFYAPARLSRQTLAKAQEAALTAHRALGLRDISRADFIVDASGLPLFLESNVAPGMTATSQLPQSALAAGYSLPELYSSLVRSALSPGRSDSPNAGSESFREPGLPSIA